ncbi:MAG: hypothetical protein Q7R99_01345 [bacterium]|nr:hypothetical protein [bacterium]
MSTKKASQKENKKKKVLSMIFKICKDKNDFVFDNDLVKAVSKKVGFQNHFDATKLDTKERLPVALQKEDFALIHLGSGKHQFIKDIEKIYHNFEPIQKIIDWQYKKSILNQYNTSESNILSVANNQRILHHFLFGQDKEFDNSDIASRPKTYFPHRTKANLGYGFGKNVGIKLNKVQIEIDLTIEFMGKIGIFEAKNGKPTNFSIYQIYHPFLYYWQAKQKPELKTKIKEIVCIYVVRERQKGFDALNLYAYTFTNPQDITSIKFLKSVRYNLINQNKK